MLRFKTTNRGFTLVELVFIVVITSLLTLGSVMSLSFSRQRARDVARVSAIKELQAVLELYRKDNGRYPEILAFGSPLKSANGQRLYVENLPNNPWPWNDGNCPAADFGYLYNKEDDSYNLKFCLSAETKGFPSGENFVSPGGLVVD